MGYWLISSIGVKRDSSRRSSIWISVGIRLLFVFALIFVLRSPNLRQVLLGRLSLFLSSHSAIQLVGAVLCVVGVALAVWARAILGTNWSGRPAIKEDHELVTSGPYNLIRHPIYSGMLLAMLGTSLVVGIPGLLVFIPFAIIAAYRIGIEERLLTQIFADEYQHYRERTKTLIPFVI